MAKIISILLILSLSQTISASFYKDAIQYLASDELEGRRAGTSGNIEATNYSISKLKEFGVEKFAGSYTQDFTIFTKMIKTGENFLKSSLGDELLFEPISSSLSGSLEHSDMVFVGYGISIPKSDPNLIYDDYEGVDVEGKIVVVMTGDPAIGNLNSPFRHPDYLNYRSLFYKFSNAVNHGAKGVIVIENPLSLSNYPSEPAPIFNPSEGGGNRFSAIAGYATNKWINSILKPLKTNSLSAQNKIVKTGRPNSFYLPGKYSLAVNLKKKTGRVSNVVGVIPGQDETLKSEVIVIGAHFDHIGLGGESSMDPHGHGKIHNGADDNASGTAMVLKLAKELSRKNLKRTHIFVLFNAEEVGLLGSAHFVDMWQRHGQEYGSIKAMLNFDMIGRYKDVISVMGAATSIEWRALLNPLRSNLKFEIKDSSVGSSDHASFIKNKIPSLFLTTGAHEDYHRSTDTAEKINYESLELIEKYSLGLVANLERNEAPVFNPDYSDDDGSGRQRGYGAHLGCVPEFGQSDDIIGVLCVRASDNSPAMSAGIVSGDILVQIGDIEIKTIYDLAFALKYYRAGDKVELGWKRGSTIMKKVVTLAKSTRH
ncbi:M28 family peptidase [Halobacteriovorax sp. HLS]|uniref:M28 family peptidase n=1 Tax=Halobacteriovorax sp. HLS TaxID=2234000 RepID=UPI000FD97CE2|nr:M28 family peptidase [Halobacteriovorax sp. HLS]